MRLINYLSYSGLDDKTNTFRSIKIKLIDKPKDYTEIFEHITKKYEIVLKPNLMDDLNKEMRRVYKGKFAFAYCLDEGVSLNDIKINKKHLNRMKLLQFEASNDLSRLKTIIERKSKDK